MSDDAHDVDSLAVLDKNITDVDLTSVLLRWDFGRRMLLARDGRGRLPNGYLEQLVAATGQSRRELGYRQQFAAKFPDKDELCNALQHFAELPEPITSWYALTQCKFTLPVPDESEVESSDDEPTDEPTDSEAEAGGLVDLDAWEKWLKNVKKRGHLFGTDSIELYSDVTRQQLINDLRSLLKRLEKHTPRTTR